MGIAMDKISLASAVERASGLQSRLSSRLSSSSDAATNSGMAGRRPAPRGKSGLLESWLLLGGAALLLILTGCRSQQTHTASAKAVPPVTAAVQRIEAQPFAATVPVTGTLVSRTRVDVKAETMGRVARFDKEEGNPVTAGEPVVWVNDENYQLAARQSQTTVEVAEAALERARVQQAHARAELDRARNLIVSGGITDKDLKAAQMAEQDARAQVSLASAQLDQSKATHDVARKRLRDAIIHAPVGGEIQKKFVNVGAYVEAPTALFTIVDNRRLELEVPVASADLAPIRNGQKVTFTVNSYPGKFFEGRVIEISPAVEAETRSAKVRIQAPNPEGKLKSGMFAEGEILTGTINQAIVIPSAAAYRDDRSAKSSFVFIIEKGKAARRPVRIGRERDSKLEILEGLHPGDMLIAEQSIELAEGVPVEARK